MIQTSSLTHQQVYAVGTIDIVQEALQASTGYDWRVGGSPLETLLECDACSLDVKLLESHARVVQAFLATGEHAAHATRTTGAGPHLIA